MQKPNAPNVPVTTVSGTDVIITWDEPYTGGIGVTISGYDVLI